MVNQFKKDDGLYDMHQKSGDDFLKSREEYDYKVLFAEGFCIDPSKQMSACVTNGRLEIVDVLSGDWGKKVKNKKPGSVIRLGTS